MKGKNDFRDNGHLRIEVTQPPCCLQCGYDHLEQVALSGTNSRPIVSKLREFLFVLCVFVLSSDAYTKSPSQRPPKVRLSLPPTRHEAPSMRLRNAVQSRLRGFITCSQTALASGDFVYASGECIKIPIQNSGKLRCNRPIQSCLTSSSEAGSLRLPDCGVKTPLKAFFYEDVSEALSLATSWRYVLVGLIESFVRYIK